MPILSQLTFYPIKSCAGISLSSATLTGAGLMHEHVYDREWMLVDDDNNFLTQREHPRMALITPRLRSETLELRAPGMLRLDLTLDLPDPDTAPRRTVKLWQHTLDAYDGDSVTRQWFSQFLGVSCQLVRFHPEAHHPVNPARTGGKDIGTLFSDGYPLLLIGQASLDDLNRRLAAQGRAAPRLAASKPSAPLPANRSRQRTWPQVWSSRCSSQLNTVSRTRSGVGRSPSASSTGSGVRFH
jgi:uncharacterized protein YcbX